MAWNDEGQVKCRFQFICPQQWSLLRQTDKDGVRHCLECHRDVYLALTEKDFRRHSQEGRCVAVPVAQPDGETEPGEPCWVVGMIETLYGAAEE